MEMTDFHHSLTEEFLTHNISRKIVLLIIFTFCFLTDKILSSCYKNLKHLWSEILFNPLDHPLIPGAFPSTIEMECGQQDDLVACIPHREPLRSDITISFYR
jgi:hypothetical protein